MNPPCGFTVSLFTTLSKSILFLRTPYPLDVNIEKGGMEIKYIYLIIKMDYIKILLLVYLVLRAIQFFPNQNFALDNPLQNTLLGFLLILLAAHDPLVCLLVVVIILVNTPSEYKETLFTNIDKEEIRNLTKTLPIISPKPQLQQETPVKEESETTPQPPIEKPSVNKQVDDCVPEFIISKKMLLNAQNNIFDTKNLDLFPNEINEKTVNIQGFYDDISGFDP
jgi:hypothetical protein